MKNNSACRTALEPIVEQIERNHQLFLLDQPIQATLNNLRALTKLVTNNKPIDCAREILRIDLGTSYMGYYLESTSQNAPELSYPSLTPAEKRKFISAITSISDKVSTLCSEVTCDSSSRIKTIPEYASKIYEAIQPSNPSYQQYVEILLDTSRIKEIISINYRRKFPDQRYYNTFTYVIYNMDVLFDVPRKYLLDLSTPRDFRNIYASQYFFYLANYNNFYDESYWYLNSYSNYYLAAAIYHTPRGLVWAVNKLHDQRLANWSKIPDKAAEQGTNMWVDEFTNRAIELLQDYCAEQGEQCN